MAPTAAETRDAILRNARAAEHERLRIVARKNWPDLDDDQLDAKVRELQLEKLDAAGRLGRATQRDNAETGKLWKSMQPHVIGQLEDTLALVRAITCADDERAA